MYLTLRRPGQKVNQPSTPARRHLNWPAKFERWETWGPIVERLSLGSSEATLPGDTWSLYAGSC